MCYSVSPVDVILMLPVEILLMVLVELKIGIILWKIYCINSLLNEPIMSFEVTFQYFKSIDIGQSLG